MDLIKRDKVVLLLLIVVAFVSYMLTIIPSGSEYCFNEICGVFYWGAHGHDAIWHLAITAVSFDKFPFISPIYAGATLDGYNYFLDLVIFILTKVGISASFSYFKLLPVIWFGVFTYLLVRISKKIHNSITFSTILLFFMYFSGSFSYLITFIKNKTLWGSSGLLAMQPLLTLTNLQFAFSIVILIQILILIKENKTNRASLIFLSMLVALNLAVKFYAGIVSFFLVFLYFAFAFIKSKNTTGLIGNSFFLSMFSMIVVLLFYRPNAQTIGGAPFSFSPLATVYPLIEDPNLLYLKDMTNAKYFLENAGNFSPRLLLIKLEVLTIFIVLNFGTRIVGLLYLGVNLFKRKLSQFDILVFLTIVFSVLLNILLVQRGQWWNTVQFSYYAFFLSNIFAAQFVYLVIKRAPKIGVALGVLLFFLTIPTSLDTIKSFAQFPSHTYLPRNEVESLKFLKSQPNGVVYSPLPSENSHQTTSPEPLSSLGDNAYVTAFSDKQSYIADEVQLQLTGIDYKKRAETSYDWNCATLKKVNYLYELSSNPIEKKLDKCRNLIRQVFRNKTATVYTVSR